ncbi:metalloendoproteinase 1-like [Vigna radiata var. radiata]|uniref:Metalloendoproteinase 1-like n=1 Tax=Vigna radiata var. radiata TaxID=3916 RepID=A0A1S3W1L9_VIGRR|nr:metalloendoproteinase 1-like [Vigna radiata var. radiata]
MKPYLSAFLLLFLLLLHQSQFAKAAIGSSLPSNIQSALGKIKNQVKGKNLEKLNGKLESAEKYVDFVDEFLGYLIDSGYFKKNTTLPNLPLNKERKGFAPLKKYLSNFGYLPSSDSFNNTVDHQTLSAIKTFMESFNLPVTSDILKLMSLPRCAVPDMNFDYSLHQNVSWPKADNRWFQKTNLTYGFHPAEFEQSFAKVFKNAFKRWENAAGVLNLTETTYDDADIKVGFYNLSDVLFGNLFGLSLIRENPPSSVKTAEVILNGDLIWALPSEKGNLSVKDGIVDLESAAMHQIGHLLGFDHSFMNDSVMYPYILPSQERKVELSNSDKNNTKKQYANVDSGDGGCLGVPSITALLSLGFAYVLLMY